MLTCWNNFQVNIEDRNAYANAIEGTFNPLLKVLCTFPLWYLYAIGIGKLMSLAHSLLCHSQSSPKEHNSAIMECMSVSACVEKGSHLLFRPFQKCSHSIQPITHQCGTFFIAEVLYTGSLLFIRHYLEYHLHFLLPPLTYMLKFSRLLHQYQVEKNGRSSFFYAVLRFKLFIQMHNRYGVLLILWCVTLSHQVPRAFASKQEKFLVVEGLFKLTQVCLSWGQRHDTHSTAMWITTFRSSPRSP